MAHKNYSLAQDCPENYQKITQRQTLLVIFSNFGGIFWGQGILNSLNGNWDPKDGAKVGGGRPPGGSKMAEQMARQMAGYAGNLQL